MLVADSGAFIRTSPLEKWSSHVVTVKEVVTEVRDEATRSRLQILPYELHLKEPSQAALQHGEFSLFTAPQNAQNGWKCRNWCHLTFDAVLPQTPLPLG